MATTRLYLSGSTTGRPIPVSGTATGSANTIHTVAAAPGYDAVFIYASNVTGTAATLTIEWGGTATGDHLVDAYSIPANSAPIPIATGQQMSGGLTIKAFSGTASAINITGYALRNA